MGGANTIRSGLTPPNGPGDGRSISAAWQQASFDLAVDAIFVANEAGQFIEVNPAGCRLLGYTRQEVLKLTWSEVIPVEGQAALAPGQSLRQACPLRGRAGRLLPVALTLHRLADGCLLAFGHEQAEAEIRRLNQGLEQQVIERTAQLAEANKELEAFAYSVAHDLRAPLRAIDGFTRMLQQQYEAAFDDEGRRLCAVIAGEARRMGQLIDDLLTFSRLGRAHMEFGSIDMVELAAQVFKALTAHQPPPLPDFRIDPLPPAMGDSAMIRQVWQNLLTNAIKFSAPREQPMIEVGSRTDGAKTIYYVRDNGVGFDMRYVNKLFGVFQRLHAVKEFEGTGVGLAIVQRMIQRHGGRVWAEGEPGQGATFYFTLSQPGEEP